MVTNGSKAPTTWAGELKKKQAGPFLTWHGRWQEGAYVSLKWQWVWYWQYRLGGAAPGHKIIWWIHPSPWTDGGWVRPWELDFPLYFSSKAWCHPPPPPVFSSFELPFLLCQYTKIVKFHSPQILFSVPSVRPTDVQCQRPRQWDLTRLDLSYVITEQDAGLAQERFSHRFHLNTNLVCAACVVQ